MTKKYYITTPLYYVNDVPHIGHAYTTIAADVLARWKRLQGIPVFFLTGTDEHGAKIAQAAQAKGENPQAYADRIVESFKLLWKRLEITNDDFIRTTEKRHEKVAQSVFETLLGQGDIYKGTYEDWYCTPCETFWSESELIEGKCPTCGRPVEKLKEESYFFKLSRFEKPLLSFFEKNPGFLQPKNRSAEILNFVKQGLKDLSVSRTKVKWGITVPSHPHHTIYVWFEALLNYISAPGYLFGRGGGESEAEFSRIWPANVHFVGKEIYRFHTVIWPAMLMALKMEMPERVFAHGWWTVEGEKMSKSKGNFVDPHEVSDEVGVDALRFFMLREVPFGGDGDFSKKALMARYNGELANGLGNLLNRSLQLIEKNFSGEIPPGPKTDPIFPGEHFVEWVNTFEKSMEDLRFHEALQRIMGVVNSCNRYMDESAPWKTVKTNRELAGESLHAVLRTMKLLAILLHPFMPQVTKNMWGQLGESDGLSQGAQSLLREKNCFLKVGQQVKKGAPLFPRIT